MLDETADAELRNEGLTPFPREWTQFGFSATLAALECPWGDDQNSETDTYYAWAQFLPGQRDEFVALVLANGYLIEESDRGAWLITPSGRAGGGGGEVLITDGWVAFADTREKIDDIVWTE
jgi:hypothetical protein